MAANRTYEPFTALRVGLPTLIIAGLAATAMHLSAVPATADGVSLLTTGDAAPTPAATATAKPAATPPARRAPAAITGSLSKRTTATPRPSFTTTPQPVPVPVVPVPAPTTIPDVDELTQTAPTAPTGQACDPINGFIITVTDGQPTCVEIHKVAGPYTQAVLANELGRELSWSGDGWDCVRNFDPSGVTAKSHGLICQGKGTFILVSE